MFGNTLPILLLDDLTRRYKEEIGCMTIISQFYSEDSNTNTHREIMVPSADDWQNFRKWCNNEGVTANLKKKVIDQAKVWWPSDIELIIRDTSNEHLVFVKLKNLY